MSKNLWVSADGSWGVNPVKKFDATNWLDKDWDRLDGEPDSEKLAFAKYITRKRNKQAKKSSELAKRLSDWRTDPALATYTRTFIIGNDGSVTEEDTAKPCVCGKTHLSNLDR